MALIIPGAIQSPRRSAGAMRVPIDKGCLHSTEGGSLPPYPGTAPQVTVDPRRRVTWQHMSLDQVGMALKNAAGGVQTNTDGVVQIEIIGTCDWSLHRRTGILYVPQMTADELAYLATQMRHICNLTGIPMTSTVPWKSYASGAATGSGGPRNGVRLSFDAWNRYTGWLGHQHVPENDHGDPGDIDITSLLALMRGASPLTIEQVLQMELTDKIESRIPGDLNDKGVGKTVTVREIWQNIQVNAQAAVTIAVENRETLARIEKDQDGYGLRIEQVQGVVDGVDAQVGEVDAKVDDVKSAVIK